ncbi:hypothetical protein CMUS01_09377 [Colletotrichum musicola]|uniref:Uncharacterized protein n=1 Tax=Colletotrichum musicola TaxID=2175873 RepID=A0A8H6K8R5_9PEZI|nr:hypothetical protein CMUS01_09377 [Colletotrichum musicola]
MDYGRYYGQPLLRPRFVAALARLSSPQALFALFGDSPSGPAQPPKRLADARLAPNGKTTAPRAALTANHPLPPPQARPQRAKIGCQDATARAAHTVWVWDADFKSSSSKNHNSRCWNHDQQPNAVLPWHNNNNNNKNNNNNSLVRFNTTEPTPHPAAPTDRLSVPPRARRERVREHHVEAHGRGGLDLQLFS